MKQTHRLHLVTTKEQYEKLRRLAFNSRKSIAQILREWIDEKLINYSKKGKK